MRVAYFQRVQGVGYSIERLFAAVRSRLPEDVIPSVYQAPCGGARPLSLLRNYCWARGLCDEINHVTGDAYYLALALPARRTVLTIFDCVALNRLTGPRKWIVCWLWYRLPAARAAVVTVPSEEAKRELQSHVRIAGERIRVIPCCIGDEFRPQPGPKEPGPPVLLHVGTTPNKNLSTVCRALTGMPVSLRIIGRLTDADRSLLAECRIDFTSVEGVSDEGMLREYAVSDAVVFASTYEGFGLPIVEAQAVGRPVVTSDRPPMSGIAGGGACLVDPHEPLSIRDGVARVLGDPVYREELVRRGYANVETYRAERIAGQFADLYREMAPTRSRDRQE